VKPLGYVLSGSSTSTFEFELTRDGERLVREGMLVVVEGSREQLLARVDSVRIYSGFYKANDYWASARREGFQPPKDALKYAVASATIIGSLDRRGLREARWPPEPGDIVRLFTREDLPLVYGFSGEKPGIIWFGSIVGYEELPLALDVEAFTMHLGVFGETGSGKSYGFGYLLELLASIPAGDGVRVALPALVVDANGDYLDYWDAYRRGKSIGEYETILRLVSPKSRASLQPYVRTYTIDLEVFSARELAEFIAVYKSGGWEVNELQVAVLERVFAELAAEGYSYTRLLTEQHHLLVDRLEELARSRRAHHQTVRAAIAALEKFYRDLVENHGIVSGSPTLSRELVEEIVGRPGLAILDFSAEGSPGIPLAVKQLVVAYVSRLLYNLFTGYKIAGREAYILYALEEAQNYAPNPRRYPVGWSLARDYLSLIATQGRKFGICLAVISQRPAYVDPVIVSMINTFIVYRLSVDDIDYIAKLAGGIPKTLQQKLANLPRGIALIFGQANLLNTPLLVKTGRRSVEHRMGKTGLVEALRRLQLLKTKP